MPYFERVIENLIKLLVYRIVEVIERYKKIQDAVKNNRAAGFSLERYTRSKKENTSI